MVMHRCLEVVMEEEEEEEEEEEGLVVLVCVCEYPHSVTPHHAN
jgi:hypothetical protein